MKLLFKSVLAVTVFAISIQVQASPFAETSTSDRDEKIVFISGEVVSPSDKTIEFMFYDLFELQKILTAQIDENNHFQLSFSLTCPQDFYIRYGGRGTYLGTLFCSPGDSLFIKINANYKSQTNSDESRFVIKGTNKQTNDLIFNFLNKIPKENHIYANYDIAIKSKSPLEYLEYIKEREKLYRDFYDKFVSENQTTEMFRKWASKMLKYESYDDLLKYTWYHPDLNKISPSSFDIPKEYFVFLESYDMNDSEIISMKHALFLHEYALYFTRRIENNLEDKFKTAIEDTGNVGAFAILKELIEKYTSGFTKDFLFTRSLYSLLKGHALEEFRQVYDAGMVNNDYFNQVINTELNNLISFLSNSNTESANISILDSQSDVINELTSKYSGKWIYLST